MTSVSYYHQVEQEVAEQIEEWEQQMGRHFLVNGERFLDFTRHQWETYKIQKENEKSQRVRVHHLHSVSLGNVVFTFAKF